MLLLGVAIGRWPGRPGALGPSLDWFVVRVAFPARIITLVPQIQPDVSALVPVAVAWAVMGLVMLAVVVAARMFGWSRRTLGTMLVVPPFGNTAFLGFPAVHALLGEEALGYALLYDQLGSFLALATVGSLLLGIHGSGPHPTLASVARRTITFPPFVAFLAGVALRRRGHARRWSPTWPTTPGGDAGPVGHRVDRHQAARAAIAGGCGTTGRGHRDPCGVGPAGGAGRHGADRMPAGWSGRRR